MRDRRSQSPLVRPLVRALVRALVAMIAMVAFAIAPVAIAAPRSTAGSGKKASPSASASVVSSAAPIATATASASATVAAAPSAASTIVSTSTGLSPLTPRADETPPVAAAPSTRTSEAYAQLMSDAAALRARVGAVSTAVFTSRLAVRIRYDAAHGRLASARLLLDGAPIWSAPAGFAAPDDVTIYDSGLAPGMHALTIEIERRDDRDEAFRTLDRSTSTLLVPQGKRLEVGVRLEDDSSMGDMASDGSGHYDLRIRVKSKAVGGK